MICCADYPEDDPQTFRHVALPTTPRGNYTISKVFGEALGYSFAHQHAMEVVCVRIGNFDGVRTGMPWHADPSLSGRKSPTDVCVLSWCMGSCPSPSSALQCRLRQRLREGSDSSWCQVRDCVRRLGFDMAAV
eukprot:COSAG01_NODE_9462_length_2440_cov_2.186245_3_plen_133_part_00